MSNIHIVFDGPPGPESGRFVEVEDDDGKSISVGKWSQRGEFWELVIPDHRGMKAAERERCVQVCRAGRAKEKECLSCTNAIRALEDNDG